MNFPRFVLFILFHVFFKSYSFQIDNSFIKINTEHGISNSIITALEKDDLGQLWIGTRNGLNKFDGENITVFKADDCKLNTLISNDITALKRDDKGILWIGTNVGLNSYNLKTKEFKKYIIKCPKDKFSHLIVKSIYQLKNGSLWIGTSRGLFVYNNLQDTFGAVNVISKDGYDVSNHTVNNFLEAKDGVWISTNKGLCKLNNFKKKLEYFPETERLNIQDITFLESQKLLLATKKNGLKLFNTKTSTLISSDLDVKIKSKDIRNLKYDSYNNLWVGTFEGLYVFSNNKEILKLENQKGKKESLSKNSIREVYTGENGEVIIGTYYGGINILNNNSSFKKVYYKKANSFKKLALCNSITKDKADNIYFVSKGIKVFNNDKTFKRELSEKLSANLQDKQIKKIAIVNSKLWITTLKNGVFCFNLKTEKFEKNNILNHYNKNFKGISIYDIVRFKDYLIFGTFGSGLIVYNLKDFEFVKEFKNKFSEKKIITHNQIRSLLLDSLSNNLWIGTEKGITKFQFTADEKFKNPKISFYLNDNGEALANKIISFFKTNEGEIITGSYENGLFMFENNSFQPVYHKKNKFQLTSVYSILGQVKSSVFFTSNVGVTSYDFLTKEIRVHNESKTFKGNDFLMGVSLIDNRGDFYFSTVNNVIKFNPNKLEKKDKNTEIILTNFQINQKDSDKNLMYVGNVTLNPDEHFFTIQFACPDFNNLHKNTYAYRLKGLNNEWVYTKQNEASFIPQQAGNYTFEVKLADTLNAQVKSIQIRIKAPWWKTNWAYSLYVLLITSGVYLYVVNYKNNLKLKFKLEKQQLKNQNQEVLNKKKIDFFTNISHDLRTPLSLILLPLKQILKDYNGNVETFNRLKIVEENANQLLKLSNEVLFFRSLEERESFNVKEENVVCLIDKVYQSFKDFAELKNIKFSFKTTTECLKVYCNELSLQRMFYNLLSNAFKHSPEEGEVSIIIYENDNNVVIEVSNFQNEPLNKEEVNSIFSNFYSKILPNTSNNKSDDYNSGFGIGLYIARKIIDLHKGKIDVVNKNKEIVFKVEIKKGKEHFDNDTILEKAEISNKTESSNRYDLLNFQKLNIKNIENLKFDKNKRTLLIVEDNIDFRSFLIDNFKNKYNVKIAKEGREAYFKALNNNIDLVISDVKLPLMSGVELCKKLKENKNTNHIPIILLTSLFSTTDKFKGLLVGADAYVSKPFNISEFNLLVSNLINTKVNAFAKTKNSFLQLEEENVSTKDDLINRAHSVVEKYIEDYNFNVTLFARELGLSRTMLFLKIKEYTNQTPKSFITYKRMQRAVKLLENKDLTVSEVAYKVGYKDCKHFSKVFKSHHQLLPSIYREKFFQDVLK